MKTYKRNFALALITLMVLGIGLSGCQNELLEMVPQTAAVQNSGSSNFDADLGIKKGPNTIVAGTITGSESAGLMFMREEEKVARDLYLAFYGLYGKNIFNNISNSEQSHMNAILNLLNKYGLPDPVGNNGPGVFVNPNLQALYNALLAQGQISLIDALKVGAEVEEVDILDLDDQMALTQKKDLIMVYEQLAKGSRNHLRSYVSQLAQKGVTYVPQHLDQATFDAIINSPMETGP